MSVAGWVGRCRERAFRDFQWAFSAMLLLLLLLLLALLALALLDPTSGAFWLLLVYQSRADVTSLLWSMLAVGGSGYRGGGCMD